MHDKTGATIGALAETAGVNVETIRFYQRKGLMPEPEKPYGSIRRYGAAELARVRFIKSAQRLGFSLEEIGELLKLEDGARCSEARQLAEQKLVDVRQKLSDLQRIESVLAGLVARCSAVRGRVNADRVAAGGHVMELLRIAGLFAVTAVAEIVGCYLPWLVLKQGRSVWLLIPAAASLALFAWLLTLHPSAAGRTYAAYGGMYIAVALVWLWLVDGVTLTRWDLAGASIALIGMAVIALQPEVR